MVLRSACSPLAGAPHPTPWKTTPNKLAVRPGPSSPLVLSALQSAHEAGPPHPAAGAYVACPRRLLLRTMLTRGDQTGSAWLGRWFSERRRAACGKVEQRGQVNSFVAHREWLTDFVFQLAAMAWPSRRFGGPRARCADEQGFPSRMRPGDRPPVQRSEIVRLMWNCCRL